MGKQSDTIGLVESFLNLIGYKLIYTNKTDNANGPDIWVMGNKGRPISVEIKVCRTKTYGQLEISPVNKDRKKDDLIAIVIGKYVLIEPMEQHLKCCSKKGTRCVTSLSRII